MAERRVIAPPPLSTPAGVSTSWGGRRALPEDLLRDATRRIGVMSLLGAALWLGGTVLYHLAMAQRDPIWWSWQPSDAIALVSGLLSIGLYLYTRGNHRPEFILNLGLAHMVVTGMAIGLLAHWDPSAQDRDTTPMISWIGAVVLMFAAIMPSSPRKMLVAGAIAVSMNPISMLIARARGVWDFGPVYNVVVMHYQDYLLVGVAAVISHVVTSLGREVAKARELGSYQLGEMIGRGGMGEVYKATHRMLARPAAIKLIRPEMTEAGQDRARLALTRFRREAMAAANLRSPHTVNLYDFGTTDDGTFYFAMELLDGLDVETLVKQFGPLPASRVVHILRQVCESLEEAHAAGLVHRDIKPPNIHVGRLGLRHDFVKVLDFGLVKSVRTTDVTQTQATGTGLAPGTPAYMAPEMAVGQTVDGRADVYALGCTAYYMLTGKLVFEGADALQILVKRLQQDPVPPSQRTELEVPADLDRLILACLSRQPDDRPTAALLAAALAELGVKPWTEEEASAWWFTNHPRTIAASPAIDVPA
jgi:serine/threonine-protein kinase